MNYGVLHVRNVPMPQKGKVFPFIDKDDRKLKIKLSNGCIISTDGDYTAFEVFPTDKTFAAGSVIDGITYYNSDKSADFLNGQTVNYAISALMKATFVIRSYQPKNEQDVIVDWGDGTFLNLGDLEDSNITVSNETIGGQSKPYEWSYKIVHTYPQANKVYQIRIYGKNYYNVMSNSTDNDRNNILCRMLESDLPIASHITNISSLGRRSTRLFRVILSEYVLRNVNFMNMANLLLGASNLKTVFGFGKFVFDPISMQNLFSGCYSMTQCDLRLPMVCNTKASKKPIKCVFENCRSLQMNVADLLPYNGFMAGTTVSMDSMFKGCSKLTGTVPADLLWNNPNVTFTDTSRAFSECSDAIRSQVPSAWGGLI